MEERHRKRIINWLYGVVFLMAALLFYVLTFSEGARACKAKGGSYFANGACMKITMTPIE